jgi:probable HAF family extracellular repeat protein
MISYNNISQIQVAGSNKRWVIDASGNYYVWNNLTDSYIQVSSPPGESGNLQLSLDPQGNAYFLGQSNGNYTISIWNATTESYASPIIISAPNPLNITSFAAANNNQIYLISGGTVYSANITAGSPTYSLSPLSTTAPQNFTQITVGQQDNSIVALDAQGLVYQWNGSQFNLLSNATNFKQISVVSANQIYALDNNGLVYQWSPFAGEFINLSNSIQNGALAFSQIQADENGILYGISAAGGYQVFNLSQYLGLTNPNSLPNNLVTYTGSDGNTYAIWNHNGQIYSGYKASSSSGQYIGVGPLSAETGSGSSLTLTQGTNSNSVAQAYWLDTSGNINTAQLSSSIYGGYQWSQPVSLTTDSTPNSNLSVTSLGGDRVQLTTQQNGKTKSQTVDIGKLLFAAPVVQTSSKPQGQGYVYQVPASTLNSSSVIDLPPNFSLSLSTGSGLEKLLEHYLPKGWSIEPEISIVGTTTSSNSTKAYNSLKISLNLQSSGGGVEPFVKSNTLAGGLFNGYVNLDIFLFGQGSANWNQISQYPSSAKAKAGAGLELEVNAIELVLNSLFPSSGAMLNELSSEGILSIQGGPVVGIEAAAIAELNYSDSTNNAQSSANDYFMQLMSQDGSIPNSATPTSELYWQLNPSKVLPFLEDAFSNPNNFSIGIDTGMYLKASFLGHLIGFSEKAIQTEEFNAQGLQSAVFTNKAESTFNFFLFSFSLGEYTRIVEKASSSASSGLVSSKVQLALPTRVSYSPNSTTFLLNANTNGLLGEDDTDLVDSSDIAYVINGSTAYGVFTGPVNDNSANLSYLYSVLGTVQQNGTITWNPNSVTVIPNTAGANQQPNIAFDSNNNLLVTWQHAPISNATVSQIATTPPGQVYVLYGQTDNLANLTDNPAATSGFYWTLNNTYLAGLGQVVTDLGNISSSSGPDDLAMAAPSLNQNQGGVYIVYGKDYGQVNDLTNLGSNGLFLTGKALSQLGYSIASTNNFALSPSLFVIGAPGYNGQGAAYVIYGQSGLFSTLQPSDNIDTILNNNPSYGFRLNDPTAINGDGFGSSVGAGYNFTGDGSTDVVVSAPNATPAGNTSNTAQQTGVVTVYYGLNNSTPSSITITDSTGSINGLPLLNIGSSVAIVPDLNGDGIPDLVIGGTGAAVIIYGGKNLSSTIDLATLTTSQGFIVADDSGDPMPLQVSSAGDVTGDGNNDLIIGYPLTQGANGQINSGNSYILFGGSNLANAQSNVLNFSQLTGKNGLEIIGAGTNVQGVGDLNGDKVADLVLSEPDANNQTGVSYVIYGGAANNFGSISSINVANVGSSVQGYVINGASANALSGSSVTAVKNWQGAGTSALIVGAPVTVPSDDISNLQSSTPTSYTIGTINGGSVSFASPINNIPTSFIPAGQQLQSLTKTAFGDLAIWINQGALYSSFFPNEAIGWTMPYQIASVDPNSSIANVNVNASSQGNIILSWQVTNGLTSTSTLYQSVYTNNSGWSKSIINTYSNPTPPSEVNNVIGAANSSGNFTVFDAIAKKSDGRITFTITRSGDTSKAQTLRYHTEDISASALRDYQDVKGELIFAPGETQKTVDIKLFESKLYKHRNDKFKLVLSDGHNVNLSARATLQDTNQPINLIAIDSGFQMLGPGQADLGTAISPAGDVNGASNSSNNNRPIDSFLVSAPGDNNSQGSVYLVLGAAGVQVLDQGLNLDSLQAGQGLKITGLAQTGYALANWSSSSSTTATNYYAISAPNITGQGATGDSNIYIFDNNAVKSSLSSTSVDITALASNPLTGDSVNHFGQTIALADLFGTGTPNLIVGSPAGNQVQIYTLSGSGNSIKATLLLTIKAPASNLGLGSALAVANFAGDGQDLAIGAPQANPVYDANGNLVGYGGAVYVLLAEAMKNQSTITLTASNSSTNLVYNGSTTTTPGQINGKLNPSTGVPSSNPPTNISYYDGIGTSLAALNFTGHTNGLMDLAIGAPTAAINNNSNLGKVYVVFGQNSTSSLPNDLNQINPGQGVIFQGNLANGQAGYSVANGGDINQQGVDDLLIGAPFAYGNGGAAYIAFGSSNAYQNQVNFTLDPNLVDSRVFEYQGVATSISNSNAFNLGNVGQAVNGIGDINGDMGPSTTGGSDISLGAPSSNNGSGSSQLYVAIGHPWLQGGLSLNVSALRSDNGFIIPNANGVVPLKDVNGDGYADLVNLGNPDQVILGASTLNNAISSRTFNLNYAVNYQLVLTSSGNLELTSNTNLTNPIWETGTTGAVRAIMQSDGNLVLYNAAGQAVWASNSSGFEYQFGSYLTVGPDGGVFVFTPTGGSTILSPQGNASLPQTTLLAPNQQLSLSANNTLGQLQSGGYTYQVSVNPSTSEMTLTQQNNTTNQKTTLWEAPLTAKESLAYNGFSPFHPGNFEIYGYIPSVGNQVVYQTNTTGDSNTALELTQNGGLYVVDNGKVLITLYGPTYNSNLASSVFTEPFTRLPLNLSISTTLSSKLTLQSDGNLVDYVLAGSTPQQVWSSGTVGSGAVYAVMQNDGNFTLCNAAGQSVWSTGTGGNSGAYLNLGYNGALSINASNGTVLKSLYSGTAGTYGGNEATLQPNQELTISTTNSQSVNQLIPINSSTTGQIASGDFSADGYQDTVSFVKLSGNSYVGSAPPYPVWLTFQPGFPGNLYYFNSESYNNQYGTWQSNTYDGVLATMQSDGNFVLFNAAGQAVWSSNTGGNPGATLHVGPYGAFIVGSNGKVIKVLGEGNGGSSPSPSSSDSILQSGQSITNQVSYGLVVNKGSSSTGNISQGDIVGITSIPSGNTIDKEVTGDLNGDGYDDLVVLSQNVSNYQLNVFYGSNTGLSATSESFSLGSLQSTPGLGLADLNNDGRDEIITSQFNINLQGIDVYTYDPTVAVTEPVPYTITVNIYNELSNNSSDSLTPIKTQTINSSTSYEATVNYDTYVGGIVDRLNSLVVNSAITTGDFNGDGNPDILVSTVETSTVNATIQDTFGEQSQITMTQQGAIANDNILYGNGNLNQTLKTTTFTNDSSDLTGPLPAPSVAVGDVNGDGYSDILFDPLVANHNGTPNTNQEGWIQLGSSELSNNSTIVRGGAQDQIAVQGLPNLTSSYQINAAGDINGDGYQDITMTDPTNKLTYVVYGQNWLTQDESNNSTIYTGTNANDVFQVPNTVTTPNVTIQGGDGNNYVLLPVNNTFSVSAIGGAGNDQIGLGLSQLSNDTKQITKIDGGGGYNSIFLPPNLGSANNLNLNDLSGKLTNIQEIDLGNDNKITFSQGSLLQILGSSKKLIVNGVDSYAAPSDPAGTWAKIGSDSFNGNTYDIYNIPGTAIQVWLEQNNNNWQPINSINDLSANSHSIATINNKGQVAGTLTLTNNSNNAFLFNDSNSNGQVDPGDIQVLSPIAGGSYSYATDVNDERIVVGYSGIAGNPKIRHGFIQLGDNNPSDLGTLGGKNSVATAINKTNTVVGYSNTSNGQTHAFEFVDFNGNGIKDTTETLVDLSQVSNPIQGSYSQATGINTLGHIVGSSNANSQTQQAFFWDKLTGTKSIGTLAGGNTSQATDINDLDQVVGYSTDSHGATHGFTWQKDKGILDLGTLGGDSSQALAINNKGDIVGTSLTQNNASSAAVVWKGGQITDLNSLVNSKLGWVLTQANSINDAGQISGVGILNGQQHSFILNTQF